MEVLGNSKCAMSNCAGRPRLETELFSMLDPDDDCEEQDGGTISCEEQAAAECASGEAPPRLSFMFEHNDLINNRIAALASAIRTGVLTPRVVRWSMSAAEVASTGGNCSSSSSSRSSASSRASSCRGEPKLVHPGLVESERAFGAEAEHEKSFEGRCRVLEHMLQEAQRENASLREQLALASLNSARKATKQSAEGVQLHRPAGERNLSVSVPDSAEPLGQSQEEQVSTTKVPPLGAVRRSTQRRQTRRRLARLPAVAGLSAPPVEKLEECETIITRLVDEIEVLTTGKVPAMKAETDVPEQDTVPVHGARPCGSPCSPAQDEMQQPRPSTFFAVEDLKNAISDFFGGFGAVEDEPVASSKELQTAQRMQMAAKKLQANKPRRTRVREEGSRSVQRSSNPDPFI